MKCNTRAALTALFVFCAAAAHGALLDHGLRLEGERMLRPGMWRFGAVFAMESSIKPGTESLSGREIDFNSRRFPISWRYGFSPKVEIGSDMQFEQNSGMDLGAVTVFAGSGVSNLDLVAKYKMFPWTTFVGRLGIYGNNELYAGSDGVDFGVDVLLTLPLNLPIGMPNLMHFNTGLRFKGGEPNIDKNNREDLRSYTEPVHLGWALMVSPHPRWALVGEVFVRRSAYNLEEEAEMALGARFGLTERVTLMTALAHGVSSGSPDWALRIGLQTTYGSLTERQIVKAEGRARMPTEILEEGAPPLEISIARLAAIADASYRRGDYMAAADAFGELVSRLPSDGRIYYNLGVCYYNLKDYGRAEGDFLKAFTLMPNDAELHLYLGHCQFLQGRTEEAKRNWEEAIRLDPSNDLARFLLSTSR